MHSAAFEKLTLKTRRADYSACSLFLSRSLEVCVAVTHSETLGRRGFLKGLTLDRSQEIRESASSPANYFRVVGNKQILNIYWAAISE